MLNCEVRGDPPPTIQWSKEGVGVQTSKRIQQLNNGSLAIYGTVVSHWSVVMCFCAAVNEYRYSRSYLFERVRLDNSLLLPLTNIGLIHSRIILKLL